MKKLFKSISLISALIISINVSAKTPRAVVTGIKGNVFISQSGATRKLDVGSYIFDFDQIFSEVGAQLTFNDYSDHVYHLSGSGHISMLNKMVELKGGYLWVQSLEESDEHFHVQTVNATVSYSRGEFIVSYDTQSGKSQLLGIKGTHIFKNNVDEFLKEEVGPGRFSFISEKYENGAPRMATPISSNAYSAVLSLYDGVRPLGKTPTAKESVRKFPQRKIASTPIIPAKPDASVIVRRKKRNKSAERQNNLLHFYKAKVSTLEKKYKKKPYKFKPEYKSKTGVVVKVYEYKDARKPASVTPVAAPVVKEKVRGPASIADLNPQVEVKKDAFEKSLINEYKKQMRHSKEINSLIKELKSFDQDYSISY